MTQFLREIQKISHLNLFCWGRVLLSYVCINNRILNQIWWTVQIKMKVLHRFPRTEQKPHKIIAYRNITCPIIIIYKNNSIITFAFSHLHNFIVVFLFKIYRCKLSWERKCIHAIESFLYFEKNNFLLTNLLSSFVFNQFVLFPSISNSKYLHVYFIS